MGNKPLTKLTSESMANGQNIFPLLWDTNQQLQDYQPDVPTNYMKLNNEYEYLMVKIYFCFVFAVALNYQTPDEDMHVYKGMFMDNGGCGYLLKPNFLRTREFSALYII